MHDVGGDLTNLKDAHSCDDWPQWDASIKRELHQHADVGTWDLVKPLDGMNIVGSKLVFHYKCDASSKVIAHKAQLVGQGFSQTEGIDYNETSPLPLSLLPSAL